jgi:homoserine acetyltransferase
VVSFTTLKLQGEAWRAYKASESPEPYSKPLEDDEPAGTRFVVEALREKFDNIPKTYDPNTVLSFKRTVDKLECADQENAKHAARLAIDSMPLAHIDVQPDRFVRMAYLFNDKARFSQFTDYILKHGLSFITNRLWNMADADPLLISPVRSKLHSTSA